MRGTNCKTVKRDKSIIHREQLFSYPAPLDNSLFVVSQLENETHRKRIGSLGGFDLLLERAHLRNRWLIASEAAAFSRAVHYSLANVLILSNTRSRGYFSVSDTSTLAFVDVVD